MKFSLKTILLASVAISNICAADVAVVVNTANSAAIDDAELPRLFMGKLKKFSSGESVVPLNLTESAPVRKEFEDKVLNRSASQVKAYWSKRMFSGKGQPPEEMGDDAAVISFVASNPGAIGYVDAASVNGNVRVIKTF